MLLAPASMPVAGDLRNPRKFDIYSAETYHIRLRASWSGLDEPRAKPWESHIPLVLRTMMMRVLSFHRREK